MLKYLMKKYALSRQGAKDFIKAVFSCMASNLVLMLPVSLLYLLVDDLMKGVIPQSHYWIYSMGMLVTLGLIYFTNYIQYNDTFFLTYKESEKRRIGLAERLRRLPLSFFGKKDLTDLTNVVLNDATALEHSFSHIMPQFFGAILSTCVVAVGIFFYNWKMAIASLWVFPAALFIVGFSNRIQTAFNRKKDTAVLECADKIQECIESVRDLKANTAEQRYLAIVNQKIKRVEKKSITAELGVALFVVLAQVLLKFGMATTALVGSVLLVQNELNLMVFFMFLLVISRIYEPMSGSLINLAAIISSKINIERMNELNTYPIQKGASELSVSSYDIAFSHVDFSYAADEPVLSDVSFIARQNEVTALIGPSGGGKSTISKLAARFWDISKGTITLGGTDIQTVDPEVLLQAYSIVFQEVTLFNNTIMENIRIGKKDATDEEVIQAAKEANCEEFIAKLPKGYQTIIGENGANLSGGERQRISIARALLKNAPIILLDEATASLDCENETQIQQAISKLIENKTVLIIAHRMRTVEQADHLILLKDGRIQEEGTPAELLAKNGLYAKMVQLQRRSSQWNIK